MTVGGSSAVAEPGAEADREVFRFDKSPVEVVRAVLRPYRGHLYLNLRSCVRGADDTLAWTTKGLTLRAELLPQLERAVDAFRSAIDGTRVPTP